MKLYGKFFVLRNLTRRHSRIVAGYVQSILNCTLQMSKYAPEADEFLLWKLKAVPFNGLSLSYRDTANSANLP